MLLGRRLSQALEEIFENRSVPMDQVADALYLLEILGPLGELSCNEAHWIVTLRPPPHLSGRGDP